MANFLLDTFTDTSGTYLVSHTGETGATWTKTAGTNSDAEIQSNKLTFTESSYIQYRAIASGVPAAANYSVSAVLFYNATTTNAYGPWTGVMGRYVDENNYYYAYYYWYDQKWHLAKTVAGTQTDLGSSAQTLSLSNYYTLKLSMTGTTIVLNVGGSDLITVTDSALSAKGSAGVTAYPVTPYTDGLLMDSISGDDIAAAAVTEGYTPPAWIKPGVGPNPARVGSQFAFMGSTFIKTRRGITAVGSSGGSGGGIGTSGAGSAN